MNNSFYPPLNKEQQKIVDDFHRLYDHRSNHTWANITWQGIPVRKNLFDLWIYQEIIHECKPQTIVECGTYKGGSALFLQHMCDQNGFGQVITVDIDKRDNLPKHSLIQYITGDSVDGGIFRDIRSKCIGRTMVILDSDHSANHVYKELKLYSTLVTKGQYIIIEDTSMGQNTLNTDYEGPWLGLRNFLVSDKDFFVDKEREKHMFTFNTNGYLKRIN